MKRSYARMAAASGMDFVIVIAAIGIIERWKHLNSAGEIAVHASKNIFATVTLLHGVAAVLLFWFVSTLAARLRQLEGGSGRLAAMVNGSGAVIAGILTIGVGCMWASHQLLSVESAALATSIIDGPTLFFPVAALIGAAGAVGIRARGLPVYSRVIARLSIPLAAAYVGGAGLMLFKNYAWINDTGYILFGAWILVLSIIGVVRWIDMDEARGTVVAEEEAVPDEPPLIVEPPEPRRPREPRASRRKFAPRATEVAPVDEDEEEKPQPEPEAEPEPAKPREPRRRRFGSRNTELAREYELQANEQATDVDEEDEEDEPAPEPKKPREPRHRPFASRKTDPEPADDADEDDDDEDEAPEEFNYGGPPRMREPVEVTPARRPAARKPAARKRAAKKTAPRKPAARKSAPRKPATRRLSADDTGELFETDDE